MDLRKVPNKQIYLEAFGLLLTSIIIGASYGAIVKNLGEGAVGGFAVGIILGAAHLHARKELDQNEYYRTTADYVAPIAITTVIGIMGGLAISDSMPVPAVFLGICGLAIGGALAIYNRKENNDPQNLLLPTQSTT